MRVIVALYRYTYIHIYMEHTRQFILCAAFLLSLPFDCFQKRDMKKGESTTSRLIGKWKYILFTKESFSSKQIRTCSLWLMARTTPAECCATRKNILWNNWNNWVGYFAAKQQTNKPNLNLTKISNDIYLSCKMCSSST